MGIPRRAWNENLPTPCPSQEGNRGDEFRMRIHPFKPLFHAACMALLIIAFFVPACYGNSAVVRFAEEGTAAYQAGEYAAAVNAWQAGLEEARRSGNAQHISVFLYSLGTASEQLNRYEDALEHYREAIGLRQQLNDAPGLVKALNRFGIVSDKLGRYAEALEAYRQALPLARQVNDRDAEGEALASTGIAYFQLGEYLAALDAQRQALVLYRQLGRRDLEASALNNIGDLYERQGRYQEALYAYRQALSLQEQLQEVGAQGRTLNNIGVIHLHLGQYEEALTYYKLSLASKRAANDQAGEAATLNNIGVVQWKQEKYQEALRSYDQALRLRRALSDTRGQGSTLTNIGMVHAAEGRSQEALETFRQALSITQTVGDRQRESWTLAQLGKLYNTLGDARQAHDAFQQSVALSAPLQAREILWEALRGLAAVEVEREQFQEAIQHYEQALVEIEALRAEFRASDEYFVVMADKFEVYDELIDLFSRLHQMSPEKRYDQKAFDIFERKQGRLFLEQMGKTGTRQFASLPESVRQREEQTDAQLERAQYDLAAALSQSPQDIDRIAESEQRLQTLQAEQYKLRATLQTEYPEYYALRYPQPVSLDELRQRVLQPDELMLAYHVMPGSTILWVIGAQQMQMRVLPAGEREMQQLVANMRNAMLSKFIGTAIEQEYNPATAEDMPFPEASYALFATLLPQDIRPLLTQERPLYIVPSGALYAIPFEALLTRPAQRSEEEHFLLEDVSISYVSSASLLKTLRDARNRAGRSTRFPLIAFAHPAYKSLSQSAGTNRSLQMQMLLSETGGNIEELEDTEVEARKINDVLKSPPESRPLQLRQDASRANLLQMNADNRLDDYQYVLFSLHGLIPGQITYVDQPALILSDDLLLMSDVFGLSLNADMVVLSACNTGRGKYERGEGVMGLTRAFMYAGTPTTAVTLWSVASLSSQYLSVGMFSSLKQGMPPAPALRAIKLQLLKDKTNPEFREPFHWAPFVIFGEGFF